MFEPTRTKLGLLAATSLILLTTLLFMLLVVGKADNYSSVLLSVFFGWQWIAIATAAVALAVVALRRKSKRIAVAAATLFAGLVLVYVPAHIVYKSGLYITGEGGPTGPEMACLLWKRPHFVPAGDTHEAACLLMSIPGFNRYLVDRSDDGSSKEHWTYYPMFAVQEVILLGAGHVALRRARPRQA